MQVYSLSQKKLIEVPDDPTMQDGSTTTQAPQVSQVQPASPTLASGESATQVDALTQPKTITGHTIEEHAQALNAAKAANDTGMIKQIKDDFDREYVYQKDTGGIDKADKADKATSLKGGMLSIAKQLQNAIANKDKYGEKEYKSLLNSLSSSLVLKKKEAENLGAAFTATELAVLSGQVPVTQSIGGSFPQRVGAFFTGKEPVQRGEVVETDDELNRKMTVLIAGMEGKEVTPEMLQSGQSEEKGIASAVGGIVKESIIDPIYNYGTDVGTSIRQMQSEGNFEQLDKLAKEWEDKAYATQNMEDRKVFLQNANQIRSSISAEAGDIAGNFSDDVYKNPYLRGLETAGAITAVAELPALAANGVRMAVTTAKNPVAATRAFGSGVKQVVRHPVQTAKTIIKDERAATGQKLDFNASTGYGTRLPDANPQVPGMAAENAIDAGTPPPQGTASNKVMGAREELARRFATDLAVTNPNSVTDSENTMMEAFKMTTSDNPRAIARELEADIPKAGEAIETHIQNLDAQIGLQPLTTNDGTGVLDQIMAKIEKTTPARANKQMLQDFRTELEGLLNGGDLGMEGAQQGIYSGTNFAKMNETRKYLTSNKGSWFAGGQPVGSPTNDQNALDWAAANAIKEVMGEGDSAGIFKQMLHRQHISFETAPVLSQSTLKGSKVQSISGGIRKGYEVVRNNIGLRTVERGTDRIPQINPLKMADGTSPIANESAAMVENAAPQATTRQASPAVDQYKGKRFINTAEIREVQDAKGKVTGLEKKMPDGKWVPYESSTRNFRQATLKPVDSAAKQGDNVGMAIDEAIQPKAAVKNLKKKR